MRPLSSAPSRKLDLHTSVLKYVLTCLLSSSDCRPFSPILQLSVHAYLILRVGLQVVETVSVGSSAQLRLLLLTICKKCKDHFVSILEKPLVLHWSCMCTVGKCFILRNKVGYV